MRRILFVASTIFSIPVWAAETVTIKQMEEWIGAAPLLREAGESRTSASARQQQAEAGMAPQLFGNGAIGSFNNPVLTEQYLVQGGPSTNPYYQTFTPQQMRYANISGVVGLRIPLFGTREENQRNLISANSNIAIQQLGEEVARWQALKGLRYAYSNYHYRLIQIRLAEAFLATEQEANRILLGRKSAGLVLEEDRLEYQTMFFAGRRNIAGYSAEMENSLNQMQMLTGHELANLQTVQPLFRTGCIVPGKVKNDAVSHPQIRLATQLLDEKRRLFEATDSMLSGGVNIAQGLQKDLGGGSGSNTLISIDFTAPIYAKKWFNAKRAQATSEVHKAEIELERQSDEFNATVDQASSQLASKRESLAFAGKRLESALEAWREARLRAGKLDGDVLEKLLQRKYALYRAANDYVEAELAQVLAQVDMLGLAQECSGSEDAKNEIELEFIPLLRERLIADNTAHSATLASFEAIPASSKFALKIDYQLANLDETMLSWYAWHESGLIRSSGNQHFWSALPNTSRILLSFTPDEIEALQQGKSKQLRSFLDSAYIQKIRVELLLGDPALALPENQDKLIALVSFFSQFSFSGIHLDIERSQLPQSQQPLWADGIVANIAALHKATPLPIALSLHPRDADIPGLFRRLYDAGLTEVTIMAYTTNQNNLLTTVVPIMRSEPELHFSVAQSVEPSLPNTESYNSEGRQRALAAWQTLAKQLRNEHNFNGIIVQSLENFDALQP